MPESAESSSQERMAQRTERLSHSSTAAGSAGGVHHATTNLLQQLADADVGEALLFVIAGGIGAGVFQFRYADFSSLHLAGRHLWHDDHAYLNAAAERLGRRFLTLETSGRKRALAQLTERLEHGPVIAFVDLASLGTQGDAEAYYTVGVSAISDDQATVHDVGESPLTVSLERLAAARSRIKKFKHRLMQLEPGATEVSAAAVLSGLHACVNAFDDPGMGNWNTNFRLDAFATLAQRMTDPGKDGWSRVFPVPERRMVAHRSLYECVALHDHGGALGRAFFAHGLRQAVDAFGLAALEAPLARYQELAEHWATLADAALPFTHAVFAEQRTALEGRRWQALAGGDAPPTPADATRARANDFPLDAAEAADLAAALADRLQAIHSLELTALAELRLALDRAEP